MPEVILQQKLFPYDGGTDNSKHPLLISPVDIVDSDNIVYTNYSTKKLRPGISAALGEDFFTGKKTLNGIDFWRLGERRLVYYDGNRLYAVDDNGQKDDITGGHVLPVDETVSFEVFAGILIICFGGGQTPPKIYSMTGDIDNLSPDAPNAPFCRVWLNSLWLPDPTIPGRMLKSNTGDPTDFLTGDSQAVDCDVNDADSRGITAIFPPLFEFLYVTKRRSVYKINYTITSSGDVVFFPRKISNGVGCISHNAAITAEDNVIFPSDRGFHFFESSDKIAGVETSFLSNNIQKEYLNGVNFRRSQYMKAVYDLDLNSYICVFPRTGNLFPSDVWAYSLVARKWYRWRSYNMTTILEYVDSTDKIRTMVCSKDGEFGFIDQEVGTDFGRRYSVYIQSAIITPSGTPDDRFQFKYMAPLFVPQQSGEFSIIYKINGRKIDEEIFSMIGEGEDNELGVDFTLGEDVLGSLPQVKLDKRTIQGHGIFYDMLIQYTPNQNAPASEGFELLGILVDVDRVNKGIGEVSA